MPGGLEPSDRKLLLAAGAVAILLAAGTFALAPPARDQQAAAPSSYASNSGGALAAYLLLLNLHYDVHRWEESPAQLEGRGNNALLVLAEPSELPTDPERHALREFVNGGGRLLFCGSELKSFFPEAAITPLFTSGWEDSRARIPSYISHDAYSISLEPRARWGTLSASQLTLYGDTKGPTVVAWRMGAGEILWWAGATPLTNAGLSRAGNLQLFLNTVSNPTPLTVYWDEYFHGQRASLWSYFEGTPVPWGLLQAFAIAVAVLFTYSRRSGPVVKPAGVSRLSPLEFVDTVGSLYQSARAGSIAVAVSYRRLRLQVSQRMGLPSSASDQALVDAAAGRMGWDASAFADSLAQAAGAEHLHRMRPGDALTLVQTLEGYSAQLGIQKTTRDKN
jgi:hypothetical protein